LDPIAETEKELNATRREMLKLHWEHYRHIETERYWFMSVYAATIGAILTIALKSSDTIPGWDQNLIIIFLMVLSFIGFLINMRWSQALKHFATNIEKISKTLSVTANFEVPSKGVWKILSTKNLFPAFYFFVLIVLMVFIITK